MEISKGKGRVTMNITANWAIMKQIIILSYLGYIIIAVGGRSEMKIKHRAGMTKNVLNNMI